MDINPLPQKPSSYHLPITPLKVITEHQAESPMLCSRFPVSILLIYVNAILSIHPTLTFLPHSRHRDGQQTLEKLVNISHHQRNANQPYNEVPFHTVRMASKKKNLWTVNAGEGVEKREPSCTVGRNVNWSSQYGEQYGSSLKNQSIFKRAFSGDPEINHCFPLNNNYVTLDK